MSGSVLHVPQTVARRSPACETSGVTDPLAAAELGSLADSVRRLLGAIARGDVEVSTERKRRLQGALAGLEAALGRGDYLENLVDVEWRTGDGPNPTDDMPSVIRFDCDFGAEIPLWPQQAFLEAMLPEGLRARMAAWQQDFERNFDWRTGWRTEEARRQWDEEGARLLPQVQEVFRGMAEVVPGLR